MITTNVEMCKATENDLMDILCLYAQPGLDDGIIFRK
jgi:hypothetical protein